MGDDARVAKVLFLRRQQSHHARCHPRHAAADAVRPRRCGVDRGAWLAGDSRTCRLAVSASGPHCGAAQPTFLCRHAAARRRRLCRSVQRCGGQGPAPHRVVEKGACRRNRRSPRAAPTTDTWCAPKCSCRTAASSSERWRRRAAASRASLRKSTLCRNSRNWRCTRSARPRRTRSSIWCPARRR